jgi:invasin B
MVPADIGNAANAALGFGQASVKVVSQIEAAAARMFATAAASQAAGVTPQRDSSAPDLRPVQMNRVHQAVGDEGQRLSPEAALMKLMMMLQTLLGESNLQSMKSRLELFQQRMQARAAEGERLSAALLAAQQKVDAYGAEALQAGAAAEAALAAAEEARQEVERLQKQLDAAAPDTPEYEALRARLDTAERQAGVLKERAQHALQRLDAATAAFNSALLEAEEVAREVDKNHPPGMPQTGMAGQDETRLTNAARLQELLGTLNQIIATNSELKLQNEVEFAQKMLKAREAENMRRSKEYQDQVEKARAAEKKMGCIGKIIGWAITVIAVVAAPFSGGASLALAAVGLALAIAEEVTGKSILGKVFEPVIQLLQKFAELLTNLVMDALQGVGAITEEQAKKVASVVAAVMTAVLMVAMMVAATLLAGSSAASKFAGKLSEVALKQVSRAVPQMIKTATRAVANSSTKLTGAMARKLGTTTPTMATRAMYVSNSAQMLQAANQTSQGVGRVVIADMDVKAAQILAALELGLFNSQTLRQMIERSFDQFVSSNQVAHDLFEKISDIQAQDNQTGRFLVGKIRTA